METILRDRCFLMVMASPQEPFVLVACWFDLKLVRLRASRSKSGCVNDGGSEKLAVLLIFRCCYSSCFIIIIIIFLCVFHPWTKNKATKVLWDFVGSKINAVKARREMCCKSLKFLLLSRFLLCLYLFTLSLSIRQQEHFQVPDHGQVHCYIC